MVSLGSCFSQAIGNRLRDGGVDIDVTPMGILFNPLSIALILKRAVEGIFFTDNDLYLDRQGIYHALSFESKRQHADAGALLDDINRDFANFRNAVLRADTWLITFGTAWCFRHFSTDCIVGNCHKLPDNEFERFLCSVDNIVETWSPLVEKSPRVIFTVSPVRHLNDGLHGNTLSKSRLHLAIETLCDRFPNAEYFPAYEALNDDLRDYRFYADDMKHPSSVAEEYIFDLFCARYFNKIDRSNIENELRKQLRELHRPIIR